MLPIVFRDFIRNSGDHVGLLEQADDHRQRRCDHDVLRRIEPEAAEHHVEAVPYDLAGRQDPAQAGEVGELQLSPARERMAAPGDDPDRFFREGLKVECRFVVMLEQPRHDDVELAVRELREQRVA